MSTNLAFAQPAQATVRPARRLAVVEGGPRYAAPAPVVWKRGTSRTLAACVIGLVLFAVVAVALFSAQTFVRTASHDAAVAAVEQTTIAVSAGDTLWGIAQAHPVAGLSNRQVIDLVKEWNGLDTGLIEPGMQLTVPCA